ncbi:MAG: GTP-binding protein [Candidatus Lokiarchaeota archaeon]|nr:GTP-binding protein [Candidatus Lokiarchaeota archaeon]
MIVSEINIKLTILGQWGVGKSSIVNTFIGKDFPTMYIPTIGSNIARKEYKLTSNHIRLNIWDIGGQRSFNPLNPVFFSNLDSALLVFDLNNPKETLQELIQTYMKNLKQHSPDCITYLIGNKSDLIKPEDSEILLNNIRQYQIEGYPIIFVSAKTQDNISEAFTLVISNFLKKIEKEGKETQFMGISKRFLESINKTEEDLDQLIINLEEIDPNTLYNKIMPTIIKKNVKLAEIEEVPLREISDLTKAQEFDVDKSLIKENIIIAFKNNLSVITDLISNLKKAPIDSLINNIDKSLEDLANLKNDFELKLDSILELESNKQQS